MSNTRFRILNLLGAGLLIAACSGPVIPITPDTLAGCWTGEAPLGLASAQINITKTDTPNVYSVDGEAKYSGSTTPYPIKNIQIEYVASSGDLTIRNAGSLPFKFKVDGDKIKATYSGTPLSLDLKRCAGSPVPNTTTPSPSPSPSK